jgi:3'-phosphoadenosine 5'-phosphosulfate sulfotransferase (PAPS reductase)/FAD synthetase
MYAYASEPDSERHARKLNLEEERTMTMTKEQAEALLEQLQAGRPDEILRWVGERSDRLLCFEAENGEERFVLVGRATEEHLRGHLRLLHKQAGRKRSQRRLQAALKNIAFFEGVLELAVPSFREGARTLPEAIMLATATTTSSFIQ